MKITKFEQCIDALSCNLKVTGESLGAIMSSAHNCNGRLRTVAGKVFFDNDLEMILQIGDRENGIFDKYDINTTSHRPIVRYYISTDEGEQMRREHTELLKRIDLVEQLLSIIN